VLDNIIRNISHFCYNKIEEKFKIVSYIFGRKRNENIEGFDEDFYDIVLRRLKGGYFGLKNNKNSDNDINLVML
jgi:hypothetical protein